MKKFKKLIPALCMLLISAVLMGTSTYAWFSMNTKVTATGMEVHAKSDSQFLQIVAGSDAFSKRLTSNGLKLLVMTPQVRRNLAIILMFQRQLLLLRNPMCIL